MITIHELAVYRGAKERSDGCMSGGEYDRVGLSILGGCESCGATLAAYNAFPSKSGAWRCRSCIGIWGFKTVQDADAAIFGNGVTPAHKRAILSYIENAMEDDSLVLEREQGEAWGKETFRPFSPEWWAKTTSHAMDHAQAEEGEIR